MLALNGEPVPTLSVDHLRFGVFVDECLVLAGDNPKPLRAVKVDTWTDIPITNYVPIFNLENIASEPDGSFVAASGGRDSQISIRSGETGAYGNRRNILGWGALG